MTRTIPAGKIGNEKPIEVVTERWYSTDLQLPLTTTHTDPMMGTVTTNLTNINRTAPDASLFQVPSDYTVETGKQGDILHAHEALAQPSRRRRGQSASACESHARDPSFHAEPSPARRVDLNLTSHHSR